MADRLQAGLWGLSKQFGSIPVVAIIGNTSGETSIIVDDLEAALDQVVEGGAELAQAVAGNRESSEGEVEFSHWLNRVRKSVLSTTLT